jgi:hypothetical protein
VVEEIEDRFTVEEMEAIIGIINSCLLPEPSYDETGGALGHPVPLKLDATAHLDPDAEGEHEHEEFGWGDDVQDYVDALGHAAGDGEDNLDDEGMDED